MNPDAPDVSATTIGSPQPKLFARREGRAQRDLSDPFEVADLCESILCGELRGVSMASTDELRAIVKLAYCSFIVAIHAMKLQELSDANASKPDIRAQLTLLVEHAAAFPENFACPTKR